MTTALWHPCGDRSPALGVSYEPGAQSRIERGISEGPRAQGLFPSSVVCGQDQLQCPRLKYNVTHFSDYDWAMAQKCSAFLVAHGMCVCVTVCLYVLGCVHMCVLWRHVCMCVCVSICA